MNTIRGMLAEIAIRMGLIAVDQIVRSTIHYKIKERLDKKESSKKDVNISVKEIETEE